MTDKNTRTQEAMDRNLYIVQSSLSVADTVARLRVILEEKMIPISLVFDHIPRAEQYGLKLRPIVSVVLGASMMCERILAWEPRMGVLLPLRIVVWEDNKNRVWLGYARIELITKRLGVKCIPEISYMEHMLANISHRACRPARKKPQEA